MTCVSPPPLIYTPPAFALPLTKGRDLHIDFLYQPAIVDGNGVPVLDAQGQYQFEIADYPAGSTVALSIETTPVLVSAAVIAGSHALVHVDHLVTDVIPSGLAWSLTLTSASGWDDVLSHGPTLRADAVKAAGCG